MIDVTETVGSLVSRQPWTARVFEQHRIDYCCGGKVAIADACKRANVSIADIELSMEQVESTLHTADFEAVRLVDMNTPDLVNYIVSKHHAYVKAEIPTIQMLADRVSFKHGETDPRLVNIQEIVTEMCSEMLAHMHKEEHVLFPAIVQIEAEGISAAQRQMISAPISRMLSDHEQVGEQLDALYELSDRYEPPSTACNKHRALFDALKRFDHDMRAHVHAENNVLFPRVMTAPNPSNN